jgi:hypothetical protein
LPTTFSGVRNNSFATFLGEYPQDSSFPGSLGFEFEDSPKFRRNSAVFFTNDNFSKLVDLFEKIFIKGILCHRIVYQLSMWYNEINLGRAAFKDTRDKWFTNQNLVKQKKHSDNA